jgi:hypothetical protein
LKKIDYHIEKLKNLGFNADIIDKKTASFSKDNIKFIAQIKSKNNLKILDIEKPTNRENTMKQLEVFYKLKDLNYIDESTFLIALDRLGNEREIKILKSIYKYANDEITEDFKYKLNISLKSKSIINKFKYLIVIIPKSSREEFISDLECIIEDMKDDDCSKFYISFIVVLHIISVLYHAFFFKLKGYFYSNRQQSNKD